MCSTPLPQEGTWGQDLSDGSSWISERLRYVDRTAEDRPRTGRMRAARGELPGYRREAPPAPGVGAPEHPPDKR
ncbi:hypothetical protein GCM10010219_30750 [Streptomyces netropsis]|nr:hypothetical protein GCM10010219_30750 [Streptomyces netropsis]